MISKEIQFNPQKIRPIQIMATISEDGDFTTFINNLFQCSSYLQINTFFLKLNLNSCFPAYIASHPSTRPI